MDGAAVKAMMETAGRAVVASVDVLSEADRATGDGDHGVGMRRGFEAVLESLSGLLDPTPDQVMKAAGTAIMAKGGGASGAIFGTLFRAGGKALEGRGTFDAEGLAAFLFAAVEAVQKRGGVTVGQKTMVDALAPAAAASGGHTSLAQAMAAAAAAAKDGVEATRGMIATTGKARSLGERSLGHIDPGALSVSIILGAMSDHIAKA
jgi:phosphoenolpyruvate---glycerone phosphotransferase subunit DhaL